MRALITGASGFIGRHFVAELLSRGYGLVTLDIAVDDQEDCRLLMDSPAGFLREFDLVIHCAAVIGGRMGIENNAAAVLTENLSIDSEMFRWALLAKPKHFVYFSSSAVYPVELQRDPFGRSLTEKYVDLQNVRQPDATYGFAKLAGEMMAEQVQAAGVRVHVFRPFSGYGEDQSLDYPFPSLIERVKRRDDPFEIWGDGQQVRDWIHVDDIVGAVMAAIEHDVEGPVNLGSGGGFSFDELAHVMMRAAGYRPDDFPVMAYRTDRPTGVAYRVADATKMHSFYLPKVPLYEGIRRALAYQTSSP
jgi:nucleoside-diphosphate-sugar epimerase